MSALYLKYRPQSLEELDLTGAREALETVMKSDTPPHAFLFSGPKGTGKTSAARIVAKILNCENRRRNSIKPCGVCEQCKSITKGSNLDVLEMDAASNRGIDDVRALREAVKLSPSRAVKKVYIIDEAHMLTTEASNALLKTLEEPPSHVVFILATTNPEKLIPTIRSRTTNILFKKAQKDEVVRCLTRVCKGEKIKADSSALNEIASHAQGSFRDAVKILEIVAAGKKSIKGSEIKNFIQGGELDAEKFIAFLFAKNAKEAINEVDRIIKNGTSLEYFLELILESLRQKLLASVGIEEDIKMDVERGELIALTKEILRVSEERSSVIEELPLEIAIINWCGQGSGAESNRGGIRENEKNVPKKTDDIKAAFDQEMWSKILQGIRPKNASTEALLRATKPVDFDGKNLTLGVFYSFHKERLESGLHRQILEDTIAEVVGVPIRISCTLTAPPIKAITESEKESSPKVESVLTESNSVLTESEDEDIIKVAEEIFGN